MQVPSAAYLWLHFIAATALNGIMDAGNAVRAQCRCRYAQLDLTGKQRRALARQLQRLTSEKEALETQLGQYQMLIEGQQAQLDEQAEFSGSMDDELADFDSGHEVADFGGSLGDEVADFGGSVVDEVADFYVIMGDELAEQAELSTSMELNASMEPADRIVALESLLNEKADYISNMEALLHERDACLAQRDSLLYLKDSTIAAQEARLSSLVASWEARDKQQEEDYDRQQELLDERRTTILNMIEEHEDESKLLAHKSEQLRQKTQAFHQSALIISRLKAQLHSNQGQLVQFQSPSKSATAGKPQVGW